MWSERGKNLKKSKRATEWNCNCISFRNIEHVHELRVCVMRFSLFFLLSFCLQFLFISYLYWSLAHGTYMTQDDGKNYSSLWCKTCNWFYICLSWAWAITIIKSNEIHEFLKWFSVINPKSKLLGQRSFEGIALAPWIQFLYPMRSRTANPFSSCIKSNPNHPPPSVPFK